MNVAHGGALGNLKRLRDLSIAQVHDGAQEQARALGRPERPQRAEDSVVEGSESPINSPRRSTSARPSAPTPASTASGGGGSPAAPRTSSFRNVGDGGERAPTAPLARVVERHVAHEANPSRREVRPPAVLLELLEGHERGLLQHVLGLARSAEHAGRDGPEDAVRIAESAGRTRQLRWRRWSLTCGTGSGPRCLGPRTDHARRAGNPANRVERRSGSEGAQTVAVARSSATIMSPTSLVGWSPVPTPFRRPLRSRSATARSMAGPGLLLADVVEQHAGSHDRGDRRRDVLAGVLRSGPVDGLEQAHAAGMEVAAGGDPHAALQHGSQVRHDVAEQVRRDGDVEPLGVLHHPHARRIHIGVVGLDVGVLPRDLFEGARPDVVGADGVRLVDERDLLAGVARARRLEGEAGWRARRPRGCRPSSAWRPRAAGPCGRSRASRRRRPPCSHG